MKKVALQWAKDHRRRTGVFDMQKFTFDGKLHMDMMMSMGMMMCMLFVMFISYLQSF